MRVTGFELVANNIKSFGDGFLNHVNRTMGGVAKMLDDEVTKNASLTCHSLADLRRLGHPYRHGYKGGELHDPNWQVHQQSGQMLAAKTSGVIPASISGNTLKASAWVSFDAGKVPYVFYVLWGTAKMIPRPFMEESRDQIMDKALKHITENLRDMVVKFKPITK